MQPFEPLDYQMFERRLPVYDQAVADTPEIDHFCTAGAWVVPAREAFLPNATSRLMQSDAGFAAFCMDRIENENCLLPLEASWGLPCPLVGPDLPALCWQFRDWLQTVREDFDTAVITGLVENGPVWKNLLFLMVNTFKLYRGVSVVRRTAVLEDGVDAWLGRRSAKFRENLRRAERKARSEGVSFHELSGPFEPKHRDELFLTMMDIEGRCWKGINGVGVNQGSMFTFYERQVHLLGATDQCRFLFAEKDGQPVGYLYGGIMGDTFRGLQFSFDNQFRNLSLGNLLQWHIIKSLAAAGVRFYDLGTDVEYKRHWADMAFETHAIVIK